MCGNNAKEEDELHASDQLMNPTEDWLILKLFIYITEFLNLFSILTFIIIFLFEENENKF